MEEFADGGRLSPLKVKEFIPAGTLGIGVDDNVWIRKARKDGKTYWAEFIETWNFKRFKPQGYDLKLGIHFSAKPELDEKYGFELKYGYTDFGGFILDIYDADTMLTVNKYETLDPQKFRDICINVRQTLMPNDPILKYEFTELVGKLTSAFEKGELRKEFTEEPSEEETKPQFKVGDIVKVIGAEREYKVIDVVKRSGVILVKVEALDDESIQSVYSQDELELSDDAPDSKFEIGDYVKVVNDLQQVMYAYSQQEKYKFNNPNQTVDVKNGTEGYVVGVYYESEYKEIRIVVKKLNATGEILHEFIIAEQGLELVKKSPKIGDSVFIKDTNYLYPSAPTLKENLGFSDPNSISKANEVYLSSGTIFSKGQDTVFLPIYGVYCTVLQQQVLMNIQGIADKDPLEFEKPFSLRGKKIIVDNANENKILQEYLFGLGYYWLGSERDVVQEFDKYPAYLETQDFEPPCAIFSMTKKQFDRSEKMEVTLEELGLISPKPIESPTEFVCNVDSTKINSAYVGAFYAKNKERIEKLNSEFSCKILEALVYLSDYENCGGGVQLPIQEAIEEDDLLGAIRNLK
jgi:hypothetical protein